MLTIEQYEDLYAEAFVESLKQAMEQQSIPSDIEILESDIDTSEAFGEIITNIVMGYLMGKGYSLKVQTDILLGQSEDYDFETITGDKIMVKAKEVFNVV